MSTAVTDRNTGHPATHRASQPIPNSLLARDDLNTELYLKRRQSPTSSNQSRKCESKDDPSSVHLDIMTPREISTQLGANSTEWKGALTPEAYLRREDVLSRQDLTKEGGLTSWALVEEKAPVADIPTTSSAAFLSTDRKVLAGCETIYKRALVKRKDSEQVEEVAVHGVASVFTPVANRGVGNARRMIHELSEVLPAWQTRREKEEREVVGSVLYSDIGKSFYANAGNWMPYPSTQLTLPTESPSSDKSSLTQAAHVRPVHAKDVHTLAELDERLIRARFTKRPLSAPTAFTVLPDAETLAWHHAREEFVGNELFGKEPQLKGARAEYDDGTGAKADVWAIWTRRWSDLKEESVLQVLRIVVNGGERPASEQALAAATAAVLHTAQREAHEWGLSHVEVWSPSDVTRHAAALLLGKEMKEGVEVVERDESIASLNWFETSDDKDDNEEVEWLNNEKFGWC